MLTLRSATGRIGAGECDMAMHRYVNNYVVGFERRGGLGGTGQEQEEGQEEKGQEEEEGAGGFA